MTGYGNGEEPVDPVGIEEACPTCGERECDRLVWIDDDQVQCQRCKTIYSPLGDRGGPASG